MECENIVESENIVEMDKAIEEILSMTVSDFIKMDNIYDIGYSMFEEVMKFKSILSHTEDYYPFMERIEKWCDNLNELIDCLKQAEMIIVKSRFNSSSVDGDEIDSC